MFIVRALGLLGRVVLVEINLRSPTNYSRFRAMIARLSLFTMTLALSRHDNVVDFKDESHSFGSHFDNRDGNQERLHHTFIQHV